jgi:hypothetical protein
MKYWGFLAAKLVVAGALACAIGWGIARVYPQTEPFMLGISEGQFAPRLAVTFVMFLYFLFCLGLLYAVIMDQRYRCRTCLRRLRMPIAKGSWTHILLHGPPRTEYICPYGHGTLKVQILQLGGPHPPDWQPHEDMWKELFSVKESDK